MAAQRKTNPSAKPKRPPATTPEAHENQMAALAMAAAEKQMREGTASSQVITHFLKLVSSRERLEQERLARENELLRAKSEAIDSQADMKELYKSALDAMRSYAGQDPIDQDEFDE